MLLGSCRVHTNQSFLKAPAQILCRELGKSIHVRRELYDIHSCQIVTKVSGNTIFFKFLFLNGEFDRTLTVHQFTTSGMITSSQQNSLYHCIFV
jgi:hypothetical protein